LRRSLARSRKPLLLHGDRSFLPMFSELASTRRFSGGFTRLIPPRPPHLVTVLLRLRSISARARGGPGALEPSAAAERSSRVACREVLP
jgi:hypothetical protein